MNIKFLSKSIKIYKNNLLVPFYTKRYFTINSNIKNTKAISYFKELSLLKDICEALLHKNIEKPTKIQQLVIPKILKNNDNFIFSAQTGTGKTFSYLLPMIHKLLQEERSKRNILKKDNNNNNNNNIQLSNLIHKPNRPRAIIFVPSRELAFQILHVTKSLAHYVKFSSMAITGGAEHKLQKDKLSNPIDILIATPGRFLTYFNAGHVYFSNLKMIVFDEADTLFDKTNGFYPLIEQILKPLVPREDKINERIRDDKRDKIKDVKRDRIDKIDKRKRKIQFLLAAATIKPSIDTIFDKTFKKHFKKSFVRIIDHSVHQLPEKIKQEFIRITGVGDAKHRTLREILSQESYHHVHSIQNNDKNKVPIDKKILVFCNTMKSCQSTEHMLREHQFNVTCIHGDIPPIVRQENYKKFLNATSGASILVCTDIVARGMDMNVDHVIMFDFPKTSVDYIHRTGRTGRNGNKGKVTSFITKFDVTLANSIQETNKLCRPMNEFKKIENTQDFTFEKKKPSKKENKNKNT